MNKKYKIDLGVKVTKTKAMKWLETSEINRTVKDFTVDKYAKDILRGNWKYPNGDTIVFDKDKELSDGQHRCWAVIRAQEIETELSKKEGRKGRAISVLVDVAHNVDREAIRTVDTGKNRSGADTLVMQLKRQGKSLGSPNEIASALRTIHCFQQGNIYKDRIILTNEDIWNLYQKYPGVLTSLELIGSKRYLVSKSLCVALHYILSTVKVNQDSVNYFFSAFLTGAGLSQGSPILALRNKFITHQVQGKDRLSRTFILSCMIKAWNAFIMKKKISTMGFNPDKLPTIYKLKTIRGTEKKK